MQFLALLGHFWSQSTILAIELTKAVEKVKTGSSSGPDGATGALIKYLYGPYAQFHTFFHQNRTFFFSQNRTFLSKIGLSLG